MLQNLKKYFYLQANIWKESSQNVITDSLQVQKSINIWKLCLLLKMILHISMLD